MPAIEIEKYGPDLYPVLVFKVDGEIYQTVRCVNLDGELIPVDEDGEPLPADRMFTFEHIRNV